MTTPKAEVGARSSPWRASDSVFDSHVSTPPAYNSPGPANDVAISRHCEITTRFMPASAFLIGRPPGRKLQDPGDFLISNSERRGCAARPSHRRFDRPARPRRALRRSCEREPPPRPIAPLKRGEPSSFPLVKDGGRSRHGHRRAVAAASSSYDRRSGIARITLPITQGALPNFRPARGGAAPPLGFGQQPPMSLRVERRGTCSPTFPACTRDGVRNLLLTWVLTPCRPAIFPRSLRLAAGYGSLCSACADALDVEGSHSCPR